MAYEFGDGIKNLFLLGVGVAATTAEKTVEILGDLVKKGEITVDQGTELLNDLVKKGQITMEQGKVFNQELQRSVKESVDKAAATAAAAAEAAKEAAKEAEAQEEAAPAGDAGAEEAAGSDVEDIDEDPKDFASYVAGLTAEELEALKEEIAKAQC